MDQDATWAAKHGAREPYVAREGGQGLSKGVRCACQSSVHRTACACVCAGVCMRARVLVITHATATDHQPHPCDAGGLCFLPWLRCFTSVIPAARNVNLACLRQTGFDMESSLATPGNRMLHVRQPWLRPSPRACNNEAAPHK